MKGQGNMKNGKTGKTERPTFKVVVAQYDRRSCIAQCESNSRNVWLLRNVIGMAVRVFGRKAVRNELKA